MKFATIAAVFVAGVSANYPGYPVAPNNTVSYTTKVVTSYETYCPGPTTITYGTATYTVTEPTTLTITNCPCTVSMPVYTTSSVICSTCTSSSAPVFPTAPAYPTANTTAVYPTPTPEVPVPTTGGVYPTTTPIPTAGAGKIAALSGAAFAGLMGVVAFAL